MPMRITTLERLKQQAREGEGFFILLNHNLRSSKWIVWNDYNRVFFITNFIDGFEQKLTEQQILDRQYTNIGFAMTKARFSRMINEPADMKKLTSAHFWG